MATQPLLSHALRSAEQPKAIPGKSPTSGSSSAQRSSAAHAAPQPRHTTLQTAAARRNACSSGLAPRRRHERKR